ncbi:hypothetical protein MBLNU457_6560t1 [Dothideomycetes sp. NU457]
MPPKRAKTAAKQDSTRAPSRTTRQTRNTTNAIASDEDVTGGLVTSKKTRTQRRSAQNDELMMVAGGLGSRDESAGDEDGALSEKGAQGVSPKMSEEAELLPKRNVRKRPTKVVKKSAQTEDKKRAIEDLRKRMEADKKVNAPEQRDRSTSSKQESRETGASKTGEQVESGERKPDRTQKSPTPVAQAVPGTAQKAPQSALKVQSTPGVESSVLALANFRRRPRQPSLLRMVQGDLGHSPLGDDTTDFTLGDDEDDFAPHDESTPLNIAKAQPAPIQAQAQTPEDEEDDLYGLSPQPKKSLKRKSDEMEGRPEVEVTRSSPIRISSPLSSAVDLPEEDVTIPATAPEESEVADDDDSEPRRASVDQEVYADPLSSPPPMPQRSPVKPTSKRGQPRKANAQSPEQSRTSRHKPQKSLDTAALRALLPKRRIRDDYRNEYDHPTSSDATLLSSEADADEDELTHRSRAKRTTKPSAPKKQSAKKTASKSNTRRKTTTAEQAPQPVAKRTYGRTSGVSDKENDSSSPLSDLTSDEDENEREGTGDTSLETVAPKKYRLPLSNELQAAKNKFAEVDEWQMEFESAPSLGAAGSSSPWR